MNLALTSDKEFIQKLTEIVEANLGDENFGVKELTREAGMSQYHIKQRLKAISQRNINQFIREVRLQKAMEKLQQGTVTASEVAYKVGFGSATYFNSCFHNFYGYPPGEVKQRVVDEHNAKTVTSISAENVKSPEGHDRQSLKKIKLRTVLIVTSIIVLAGIISFLGFNAYFSSSNKTSGNVLKNREKSIAVLPFVNLSEDRENEYFADGVMEDILTNLSHIKEFKVISRTSVEQFRESTLSMSEIAKKLGVNYVLEGSLQRYGDQVRVRVQVIDAGDDRHLLSETYDRELADIFQIQSDIARHVANELQATLSEKESKQINQIPTGNMEAYNLYLMGRFFWNKINKTDQFKSIKYFESALSIDPDFALAYAGLADAYYIMTAWRMFPHPEGYIQSKELALKALELDDNLAEAHATLGAILCWEWKWEEARKEFLLALELNPNYATGYFYYSEFLAIIGDKSGARAAINKSFELDPWSYSSIYWNSLNYYREGRFKESEAELLKTVEIFQEMYSPYYMLFLNYYKMKEDVKAIDAFQKYLNRNPKSKEYMDMDKVKNVYTNSGLKGLMYMLIEVAQNDPDPNPYIIAVVYNLLDEKEKAISWLEKAVDQRIPDMLKITSNPDLNNLHSEPRFQTLIKQMGLSDYHLE